MLKRPRRPALSAVVRPSEPQPSYSAHPVLATTGLRGEDNSPKGSPPARRAFSALIPPSGLLDSYSDESSFDGPDMSSPAQAYAKRQQIKTIRRCDGTDDFRPLTGATAMKMNESPSSRFVAAGMPGFGDNEAHGKILACHRVTEDGLMRISCQTVRIVVSNSFILLSLTHVGCSWTACWTANMTNGLLTFTSSIVGSTTNMPVAIFQVQSTSTQPLVLKNCCSAPAQLRSNPLLVVIQSKKQFSFSIASSVPSVLQLCEWT